MDISSFSDSKRMAESPFDERLTAAISVFLEMAGKSGTAIDRIDRGLLDHYISQIDVTISGQLDEILHDDQFQAIESTWRSLKFLVYSYHFKANAKVELLDISKEELMDDFEEAPEPPNPASSNTSISRNTTHPVANPSPP